MRLTQEQKQSILSVVRHWAGKNAAVYLFGSRLDDHSKGGDVDLLIEAEKPLTLLDKAHITMNLENDLGMPVDIVARQIGDEGTPFQRIAQVNAVKLEVTH